MHKPTPTELKEFFARHSETIIGEKELRTALTSGKKLIVKHGVDVTAPDLHLGHSVSLLTMRQLQEWGHHVVFLIGDFTTQIGDPTGKSETRKVIPLQDIRKNAKEYLSQVNKILLKDPKLFSVRYNSEWFGKMKTAEFLSLISHVTLAQLVERDMFQKRIHEGKEIRMHEMLYPLVQGYDSFMLKDDLTVVGSDQLFNEMMGRFYQERFGAKPQSIITTPILVGTDGIQKMGKSLGNYIAIKDTPKDKYGKIMSITDDAIYNYFRLATNIDTKTLAKIKKDLAKANPRDLKMQLAHTIVEMYDGKASADKAQTEFISQFQNKELPQDIPTHKVKSDTNIVELLVDSGLANSKSEARRLIAQNGVRLDNASVSEATLITPKTMAILQVGKHRFLKLT